MAKLLSGSTLSRATQHRAAVLSLTLTQQLLSSHHPHSLSPSPFSALQSNARVRNYRATQSIPDSPIPSTLFPNEPSSPITSHKPPLDLPRQKELYSELNDLQDTRTIHFFADYEKSIGNYIAVADGSTNADKRQTNVLLDVFNQISSLPVGYNNPALRESLLNNPAFISTFINRPALGINPPTEWAHELQSTLLSIAPKFTPTASSSSQTAQSRQHYQLATLMCGTCANEVAFKAAFMRYQHKHRNGQPFTAEDLSSCMRNQPPGSPSLSILSFKLSFHGRLFAALSASRSKDIHKVDIPAFHWPAADFPILKYPLNEHEKENREECERCLANVEELIEKWATEHHSPVAGIIVEPVLAEGGDVHGTAYFFKKLRHIAAEHDIVFIVDEVQTGGGGTGRMWAHEYWGLTEEDGGSPDVVTFSKKLQSSGFYHRMDLRPGQPYRNFNTWMGEPSKLLLTKAIIEQIQKHKLLENTQITGQFLYGELQNLQKQYSHLIHNLRTAGGTFQAYDLPTSDLRDKLVAQMRINGVQTSGCGATAVRLRPQLVFQPKHALIYLDVLEKSLKQIDR